MQPQAGRSWFIALEESKVNGASAIFEGRQGLEGDGAESVITWPPPCRYSLHNCFEQIIAEFNQTKDTRKLMFPLSLFHFSDCKFRASEGRCGGAVSTCEVRTNYRWTIIRPHVYSPGDGHVSAPPHIT